MSNSSLVNYTRISPNKTSPRKNTIDTITIHCVVGQCSVETLGAVFAPTSKQASSNYGVGYDGRIGMYVEEKDRSWCTSSAANDNRAITIEVASDTTEPYAVRDAAYNALIELVTDICKRNGIKKLIWSTNKTSRVNHENGCNVTVHRDYANKSCPGNYLYERHGDIIAKVNARLGATQTVPETPTIAAEIKEGDIVKLADDATYYNGSKVPKWVIAKEWIVRSAPTGSDRIVIDKSVDGQNSICSPVPAKYLTVVKAKQEAGAAAFTPYLVKVTTSELNIRKGPGTDYGINGSIKDKGVYTIVAESTGKGATLWGKLKSGAGWISLDYTKKN